MYPQPGPTGGRLIRSVIAFCRNQKLDFYNSHILIAVSGGADSVALAHLLVHYGRRLIPRSRITLLHIHHGWREDADKDVNFVKDLASTWGVPIILRTVEPPSESWQGKSWEAEARQRRLSVFQEESKGGYVLTAHHADDLAETVLWRLCTGAFDHLGGIASRYGIQLRPFLTQRKKDLLQYLREEGQSYREDSTNHDVRFLRSRMRQHVMPELECLFPQVIRALGQFALLHKKEP